MKGLLTSLQQTHARPRPACRMHASACLLILGSVCRTFRKAHGRYSSQKLMPRRGTANSSPGRSRIRSPTVGQEHAPLGVKHTLPQLTPQPTGLLSSPSATATELWRSVLNWSATMDHSHSAADKLARSEIRNLLAWRPVIADIELLERGWKIQDRYHLAFWDALIIAAAKSSSCHFLLTEDLQAGQDLDGIIVIDPFQTQPSSVLP